MMPDDESILSRLGRMEAGVFDLDGVVTDTAALHAAAWKDLFDTWLHERARSRGGVFRPFDAEDYRRHVDGKPRYEGVRSFLASRGIALPEGEPGDPPGDSTIYALGNRKNAIFQERLSAGGVKVFETSVAFIRDLRSRGLRTALVSSSRNAAAVLASAGLTELFDARVGGVEAARLGLKGKPDPDIFLHAAKLLGVPPARAFAVEDALSGVESAKAAGYGLVIGIARGTDAGALREHGADLVVGDLGEIAMSMGTEARRLPDALENFGEIADRIGARRPAVFLDYDGTLTPIAPRPELAVLSGEMRETVRELSRLCTVAVISGRDRKDVEALMGLDDLVYAGSHGFDIAGPDGFRMENEEAAGFEPDLAQADAALRASLAEVEGVLVERKRYAIAVHYRLVAPGDVARVEAAVDTIVAGAAERLRRTGGKKVFEIRPLFPWDKGRAVLWLLGALGLDRADVLPFYLGDDETDEDAFAALRERGIGIMVGPASGTDAHFGLSDPDAAGRFLRRMIGMLEARRS